MSSFPTTYALRTPETPRILEDTLVPKEGGPVIYHDPTFMVEIEYDKTQKFIKSKKNPFGVFKSREAILYYEMGRRLQERVHLPPKQRYAGWKLSLWDRIRVCFGCDIGIDLQKKAANRRYVNYSAKNVRNFDCFVTPTKEIRDGLSGDRISELATRVEYLKNSPLNGYQYYDENGKLATISEGVTTSADQTADTLVMGRTVKDLITGESIVYTGRPDTAERAEEQAKWIFQKEMEKPEALRKVREENGIYVLDYMVTNLMNPSGIMSAFLSFDEKASILQERKALNALREKEPISIEYQGKKYQVKINPIYFCTPFDAASHCTEVLPDSMSGKQILTDINEKGELAITQLDDTSVLDQEDKDLLKRCKDILKTEQNLLPEEELFLRDLIAKILNIPIVYHCKSSKDRTGLAVGISTVLYHWRKFKKEFPRDKNGNLMPHHILRQDIFKEHFAAQMMAGHQVARACLSSEGVVAGKQMNDKAFGLIWHKGLITNPIALRLMPERYKKPFETSVGTALKIALLAIGFFFINSWMTFLHLFSPNYQPKPWSNFRKVCPNQVFNHKARIIGERQLIR